MLHMRKPPERRIGAGACFKNQKNPNSGPVKGQKILLFVPLVKTSPVGTLLYLPAAARADDSPTLNPLVQTGHVRFVAHQLLLWKPYHIISKSGN